jgi:serine/threonine protein kinase
MEKLSKCAQCGAEIPADAPQGLCPKCLLEGGLPTDGGSLYGIESLFGTADNENFVPPTPEELAPHFPELEIIELLGRGGMGVVYKARQKRLDRLVALKILAPKIAQDPAFAERFAREARALAMLSHPHIVAVHDFGQTSFAIKRPVSETSEESSVAETDSAEQNADAAGRQSGDLDRSSDVGGECPLYYFVMEYVDGVNLRQLLETEKISPKQALGIVPQICTALQFAHDAGVVHRDIKPENILIDKHGRVKIADFGIAKLIGCGTIETTNTGAAEQPSGEESVAEVENLTIAGQVIGTPQYMAPEQIAHPQDVDHRADIYSLGVVFYQMLTGELPVGRFASPSKKVQIDVRLDEIVLRAMEKEPEQRYQQVSEIKTGVDEIVATPRPSVSDDQLSAQKRAKSWSAVPWQIWVVIAFLIIEGMGNLSTLSTNPQAIIWVSAKCLFIVGLFRGWKWVFVLFQVEGIIHFLHFLPLSPQGAAINLLLIVLCGTAYRFYFRKVPKTNRVFWKFNAGEVAMFVAALLFLQFIGPVLIRSYNQPSPAVAETLEEYRKTLVAYDLGFDSVFPGRRWTHYDADRLEMYPTSDAWPEVLGRVDTNPGSFKVVRQGSHISMPIGGPYAFISPWHRSVLTEGYATLLFLDGIATEGTVVAKSYTSLVCQGEMKGRLNFDSYATAMVKGDLSGRITSQSYFNLVVTGKFTGNILADSYAMIYLLDGCEGKVQLDKGAKVYIAGRTTKADLRRITGKGNLYLAESDLAVGEHKIGDLKVTVGISKENTAEDRVVDVAKNTGGPWVAKLPQGGVELVAISRHPSADEPWWRPDGSAYTGKPFDNSEDRFTVSNPEMVHYELVFRLPVDGHLALRKLEPNGGSGGSGGLSIDGNYLKDYSCIPVALPKSAWKVDFQGVASSDPWKTIEKHDATGSNRILKFHDDGVHRTLSFEKPIEDKNGETVINLGHNFVDRETRLIAIGNNGHQYKPGYTRGFGLGQMRQLTARFQKLSLAEIKEFCFQTRPYYKVEFKNISLKTSFTGDMLAYHQKTKQLAREHQNKEALERFIWFHEHALEYEPSMVGVRLSFALSAWKSLGDVYPPAMKALVDIRDRNIIKLEKGQGNMLLFCDVASINRTLDENDKTLKLFQEIDKYNPTLARDCWHFVKDLVFASKEYDLAIKYVQDPIEVFDHVKKGYESNVRKYTDPRIVRPEFKRRNEKDFDKECLQLIELAIDGGDEKTAEEIRKRAEKVIGHSIAVPKSSAKTATEEKGVSGKKNDKAGGKKNTAAKAVDDAKN